MITLGGNIALTGFTDRDYAELIVVKKIVGRYARQISDNQEDFENLGITLTPGEGEYAFLVEASVAGKKFSANTSESNLFVALDAALKELTEKIT